MDRNVKKRQTNVAYRCPECGTVVGGFVGKFALAANLLRLKCPCDKSALDISVTNDKKIRLSVPCLFCRQNHNFTVSQPIFYERDLFLLGCPYANMDIGFLGEEKAVNEALSSSGRVLGRLIADLGCDEVRDIQPQDMPDEEILPDAEMYDLARFLEKELEADGKIHCPCGAGDYDLRFCPEGIEIYCKNCGATHIFRAQSAAQIEEFLGTDEIFLK